MHFPNAYVNEKFINHLWGIIIMMMNLEDGSLVLIKAHGFENVISLGKNGFEPLNATCKMSCISSRWGCLFLSVLLQDFQTFH